MKIVYSIITDTGGRTSNDDFAEAALIGNYFIAAAADGLGGYSMGDAASRCVCDAALGYIADISSFRENEGGSPGDEETACRPRVSLKAMSQYCQQALLAKKHGMDAGGGMLTTLNLLLITNECVKWGHVGDTRTYVYRGRSFVRRTMDHSLVQNLVNKGELEAGELRFHPDRNKLYRAMGVEGRELRFQVEAELETAADMQFLICTDGFWENIEDSQIEKCLRKSASPEDWLKRMKEQADKNAVIYRKEGLIRSSTDNMTAIAVWITD